MRADPYVFADDDWRGGHVPSPSGALVVVERRKDDVVPDEAAVAERDAALVLKAAPRVDKDVFADLDVFAEVGVDGRKEAEAVVHPISDQPRHQCPQFFVRMVCAVDRSGRFARLVGGFVHKLVRRRTGGDMVVSLQLRVEFLRCHVHLSSACKFIIAQRARHSKYLKFMTYHN